MAKRFHERRHTERRHTERRGMSSADALLLLHGQPGSGRDWARVVALLDPNTRTLAPDRPGWDKQSGAAGIEVNGRAALAALDAGGVRRATVVGHSFGGGVAAWLAVHHPDRVARLVLVAPAANGASLYEHDRLLALPLVGSLASAAMLGGTGLALRLAPVRRQLADRFTVDASYLGSLAATLLSPSSWRAFVIEQRAMVSDLPALEQELYRITAETVIVAGAADRTVPPGAVHILREQIPGARFVLIAGAGHLLPQLHPKGLAEVIGGRERVPVA
ncbi:MAG: alpha/beta fold hydrolase [Solirubrobacteraceae bacterium]